MDGYAITSDDIGVDQASKPLTVVGEAFAGNPFAGNIQAGESVRIMTGAMIPQGADTIVMQEQATRTDNLIVIENNVHKGDHVRFAGEDMCIGQTILHPGKLITPAELGLLASLGIAEVAVKRRLRVAFFSTGDELSSVGQVLKEGQIYDSNRYTLYGMLERLGAEVIDMGVVKDSRDAIRTAFKQAASMADAILTSGGVSVGEADYVKDTLEELGEVNFWRVAMKPGKPLAIGRIDNAAFFGVPGNPVSAMATFYQFALPALQKQAGMDAPLKLILKARTQSRLQKAVGRLEYQRGVLGYDEQGELVVNTTGVQGSHILTSMSLANCFIILDAESEGVHEGELVKVQPFAGII
jgi:molybdopterin molybdotransferase